MPSIEWRGRRSVFEVLYDTLVCRRVEMALETTVSQSALLSLKRCQGLRQPRMMICLANRMRRTSECEYWVRLSSRGVKGWVWLMSKQGLSLFTINLVVSLCVLCLGRKERVWRARSFHSKIDRAVWSTKEDANQIGLHSLHLPGWVPFFFPTIQGFLSMNHTSSQR